MALDYCSNQDLNTLVTSGKVDDLIVGHGALGPDPLMGRASLETNGLLVSPLSVYEGTQTSAGTGPENGGWAGESLRLVLCHSR